MASQRTLAHVGKYHQINVIEENKNEHQPDEEDEDNKEANHSQDENSKELIVSETETNQELNTYWTFHDDLLKGPYIATEIYSLFIKKAIQENKTQIKKSSGQWHKIDLNTMEEHLPYLYSILKLAKIKKGTGASNMTLPPSEKQSAMTRIIRFIGLLISKCLIIIILVHILPIALILLAVFISFG
eukprot:785276_1